MNEEKDISEPFGALLQAFEENGIFSTDASEEAALAKIATMEQDLKELKKLLKNSLRSKKSKAVKAAKKAAKPQVLKG